MTEQKTPSLLSRIVRRTVTLTATLLIAGAAAFAVMIGSQTLQTRAAATALPEAAEPTPVSVSSVTLQDSYTRTRKFVGQIEPATRVDLSFELSGRMVERTVDEGDTVEIGQVIARLDIDLLNADIERLVASRAALEAQLEFAEAQLERANTLRDRGFTSIEREDQARATRNELQNRIMETDAAIDAVSIRLEKSVLRAPFAGQVGHVGADTGTTLAAGQTVLRLIEHSAPEVRVGLPLDLEPENLAEAEIDIAGSKHTVRLLQVRPDIDARTRTRTALFALDAAEETQTFGRTATLEVPIAVDIRGAWVPLDALKEGEGGMWTVLVVEEGVVRLAAVEVLYAEAAKAYVRGSLTDGVLLVDSGAHRIVPGQTVRLLGAGG